MARQLLKDTCVLAGEILDGAHDEDLANISAACAARVKRMFRKGQAVKLVNTRSVDLEGALGKVIKVNTKTVTVGVGTSIIDQWGTTWSGGEYNVPTTMLVAS